MRKKMMKIKNILLLLIIWVFTCNGAFAGEENERIYLIQILNQLHAIKPLIVAAAKEQPKTNRIKFHYTRYRDMNGIHNGLLDDINAIEMGIKEKLHQLPHSPHFVESIKGDYIERANKKIKI